MGKGNWSVGLIADERASTEQRDAITAIVRGAAGGPMAALSGLVGTFLGVESAPIHFDRSGAKWSVKASSFVDMAARGRQRPQSESAEPIHLDNTGHPAAGSFRPRARLEESCTGPRSGMAGRKRQEQRAVCAFFLAQRLDHGTSCPRSAAPGEPREEGTVGRAYR
jgi:hypothetical protein